MNLPLPNNASSKTISTRTILFGILVLALAFRWLGPFLQQTTGDSLHYTALAMKLSEGGFRHYNLRGVQVQSIPLPSQSRIKLLELNPSPPHDQEGDLMRELKSHDMGYYDEPIHHIAYGYPFLLAGSHSLFSNSSWQLVDTGIHPMDLWLNMPFTLLKAQGSLVFLSLIASLLCVYLTYLIGTRQFGARCGLWAAFIMAVFPIDILTSQRIWADDLLTLACLASLFFWQIAQGRNSISLAILAGLLIGAGILIKQSAIFFAFGLFCSEAMECLINRRNQPKQFPVRLPMIFILSAMALTSHWFLNMWITYHTPFYRPSVGSSFENNHWYSWLQSRPHPLILYSLGLFSICPALIPGWFQFRNEKVRGLLVHALMFTLVFILLNQREYRYILPIIPLIAIASAKWVAELKQDFRTPLILYVILQTIWSGYLTYQFAWQNWGEIRFPF